MEKLIIGKVTKAQGIKGEIKIDALIDNDDAFLSLKSLYLNDKHYEVEWVKNLVKGVFIKLKGVDDRNGAELLRGKTVSIDKTEAPKLPQGRYLIVDLIGCNILVDGKNVGKLVEILQHGSADVYVVEGKRNFMFPALKTVLKNVDLNSKEIELDGEVLEEIVVYED